MIAKLKEAERLGKDSKFNTKQGLAGIAGKVAMEDVGLFKEGSFGDLDKPKTYTEADHYLLKNKLARMEQRGYGLCGSKKNRVERLTIPAHRSPGPALYAGPAQSGSYARSDTPVDDEDLGIDVDSFSEETKEDEGVEEGEGANDPEQEGTGQKPSKSRKNSRYLKALRDAQRAAKQNKPVEYLPLYKNIIKGNVLRKLEEDAITKIIKEYRKNFKGAVSSKTIYKMAHEHFNENKNKLMKKEKLNLRRIIKHISESDILGGNNDLKNIIMNYWLPMPDEEVGYGERDEEREGDGAGPPEEEREGDGAGPVEPDEDGYYDEQEGGGKYVNKMVDGRMQTVYEKSLFEKLADPANKALMELLKKGAKSLFGKKGAGKCGSKPCDEEEEVAPVAAGPVAAGPGRSVAQPRDYARAIMAKIQLKINKDELLKKANEKLKDEKLNKTDKKLLQNKIRNLIFAIEHNDKGEEKRYRTAIINKLKEIEKEDEDGAGAGPGAGRRVKRPRGRPRKSGVLKGKKAEKAKEKMEKVKKLKKAGKMLPAGSDYKDSSDKNILNEINKILKLN